MAYKSPNEIIKGNIKVEFVAIGEGLLGEYNPDDPDDVELLRFYVSRQHGDDWEDVCDASYCTLLPVSSSNERKQRELEKIMDEVYEPASRGDSIKKICERLSWIGGD